MFKILKFNKSKQYKDDLIGLKYLINNNKYLKHNISGGHTIQRK